MGQRKEASMKAILFLLQVLLCIHCSIVAGAPLDKNIFKHATNVFRTPDLQTLRSADSIRAFRIEPLYMDPFHSQPLRSAPRFGPYPILKESFKTNAALARAIAGALLAEGKFSLGGTTKCAFAPVVAYRMGKGTNSLEILVCFQCDEIKVGRPSGKEEYYLQFETSRARLLALAKQAFPGDPIFEPVKPPENRFE